MKKITTLEQVAQMLLNAKVCFIYAPFSVDTKELDLFSSATYHSKTKEVVFMDYRYNEIEEKEIIKLFDVDQNLKFFTELGIK